MFGNKYSKLALIAGPVFLLDQVTKYIILNTMYLNESIPVMPGFFSLTHIHNPGGAFGFMAGQSPDVRKILFIFISSIALFIIFYLYHTASRNDSILAAGFALIFGGAAGNLIDRIRFGKVVDFLDFYIGDLHWPAFNVADSAISVGMGIFVFHLLFKEKAGMAGRG
jgi:signal peptidase II